MLDLFYILITVLFLFACWGNRERRAGVEREPVHPLADPDIDQKQSIPDLERCFSGQTG
jgi:hypothetical protein